MAPCRAGKNGYIEVVSSATVTEIRETYGISKGRAKRILDRLRASGVKF